MKKKKILLTLAIASMMGLAGCGETSTDPQTPVDPPVVTVDPVVTGITLKAEGDKTSLEISQTLKFTATVTGEGDFNKQYTFSVDKEDIGVISNEGVLTAKKAGTVIVTATATGDKTKKSSITITVTAAPVSEIKNIVVGKYAHVIGKVTSVGVGLYFIDDGTGPMEVYYNGYDGAVPEDIAIGKVVELTGIVRDNYGIVEFVGTSGKDEYFTAAISDKTIESTTLDGLTKLDAAGYDAIAKTAEKLTPIKFRGTALEGLEFKVDDSSTEKLHVSYATDAIKAAITVGKEYDVVGYMAPYHTKNSYNQLYISSAQEVLIAVSSITVAATGDATSVRVGETLALTATVLPENAANRAVTWSSSDDTKASISENGLVTGVALADSVTFTATAKDGSGVTGSLTLKVLAAPKDSVKSLTLNEETVEMAAGYTHQIVATVEGETVESDINKGVTYTAETGKDSIITVSDTGLITAVGAGTAKVTVETLGLDAEGHKLSKEVSVTVLSEPKNGKISKTVSDVLAYTEADTTQLVTLTGVAEKLTNAQNKNPYFMLVDAQTGQTVKIYKPYASTDASWGWDSSTVSYKKSVETDGKMIDKDTSGVAEHTVTVTGYVDIYQGTPQIIDGVVEIGDAITSANVVKGAEEHGTFAIVGETTIGGDVEVTVEAESASYRVGYVRVDQGFKSFFVHKNDQGKYIVKGLTAYNKVEVSFVNPDDITTTLTTTQAAEAANALTTSTSVDEVSESYSKVAGKVSAISGQEYTITDETTSFKVYDSEKVLEETVHIEDTIEVYGNLERRYGTPQITNVGLVNRVAATYEITIADGISNGTIVLSAPSGAYGSKITITATPKSGYKLSTLSYAGEAIQVVANQNEYQITLTKSGVIEATFVETSAATNVIVSKTIASYATAGTWVNGTKYAATEATALTLDTVASVYATGGNNTGKYYSADPGTWRFYSSETGKINIKLTGDYELVSVTLTYTLSDNTKPGVFVDASNSNAEVVSDTAYAGVSGKTAQFTATKTDTGNAVLCVSSITVVYRATTNS